MRRVLLGLAAAVVLPALGRADVASARSGGRAGFLHPDVLRGRTKALIEDATDPEVPVVALRGKAADHFELAQRPLLFIQEPMPIARERVTGELGTIPKMLAAAAERLDHYKMHVAAVPNPGLEASIQAGRLLNNERRVEFSDTMPRTQMGAFLYAKNSPDSVLMKVNRLMAFIASRLGPAFASATLVHEAAHYLTNLARRLNPKAVVNGELEAFRTQYDLVAVLDPKAERMVVLHSTLNLWLRIHPEDQVSRQALAYLDHLLKVYDTGGDERKLVQLIKDLGYHDDEGGDVPAAPTPVRA